jgi:hypothetical protein
MACDRREISGAAHHCARRAARSKTATQAPFYKIFPFIINQLERQNGNAVAVSPRAPGLVQRFEDARSQSALSQCGGAHCALCDTMAPTQTGLPQNSEWPQESGTDSVESHPLQRAEIQTEVIETKPVMPNSCCAVPRRMTFVAFGGPQGHGDSLTVAARKR